MLSSHSLQKIKTNALRRRIWFRVLSKVERSIIDLTIHCVKTVQSQALTEAILTIINKLLKTIQQNFLTQAEKIGKALAEKICEIASKWGNTQALNWKNDSNFIKFLGVNALST